eukprot:scaffold290922_cov17-Tisochrysis_lutea.AAC.2
MWGASIHGRLHQFCGIDSTGLMCTQGVVTRDPKSKSAGLIPDDTDIQDLTWWDTDNREAKSIVLPSVKNQQSLTKIHHVDGATFLCNTMLACTPVY